MIQYDWCPYERGNLDTEIDMNKRKTREETQGEDNHLQAEERGLEQTLPSQSSEGTNPDDTMISNF